jgi:aryl-alcohol dehydrogenase-like predicted oxidoreductase
MQERQVGKSLLKVKPWCLGGNVFGWTIGEKESFEVLDAFVAHGFNFIDTADYYARWIDRGGISETIIGKWMKQRNSRSSVVIATKVGKDMGEGRRGLKEKYILQAVEDSLRRLQTDHIDLYQSHDDDQSTPLEETLGAYTKLIKEGKVRAIGASNYSAARLEESFLISEKHDLARYECLQPHYNLCERNLFEGPLEEACLKNEIGVIPYYSLAAGFLTGKYRNRTDADKSVRGKGASKYLNEKGEAILSVLDEFSAAHRCTPAAIALAWLMERKSVTAPIASATSVKQVEELSKAVEVKLSTGEISQFPI